MSEEQDRIFFRNYSIVIALLALTMLIFFFLAQAVGTDDQLNAEREAKRAEMQAAKDIETTAPMGKVAVAGAMGDVSGGDAETAAEEVVAEAGPKSGEEVYNGMCVACHSVPGIGAPVVGNADEWAPRIAKGIDTLYSNAINGFSGPEGYMMPARGGGQFSDDEVKAAVDYMVAKSQ